MTRERTVKVRRKRPKAKRPTRPFHGGNRGSNPRGDANSKTRRKARKAPKQGLKGRSVIVFLTPSQSREITRRLLEISEGLVKARRRGVA